MMIKMQTNANECEKTSEASQKPIVRITADVITPFLDHLSLDIYEINLKVVLLGDSKFMFERCGFRDSDISLMREGQNSRRVVVFGNNNLRGCFVVVDKSVNNVCRVFVSAYSRNRGFSLIAEHIDCLLSEEKSSIMARTITRIDEYDPSHDIACTKILERCGYYDYQWRLTDLHQKMCRRYLERQHESLSLSLFCRLFSRYHGKADLL